MLVESNKGALIWSIWSFKDFNFRVGFEVKRSWGLG